MKAQILNYVKDGFALTNKALLIYFISLILAAPILLSVNPIPSPFGEILYAVWFFIQTGFFLSLPLFLVYIQKKEPLSLKKLLNITWKNTLRSVLPIILILILLILLLGLSLFITGLSLDQIAHFSENFSYAMQLFSLFWSVVLSFFIFAPILFSLEQKNLLRSTKESILLVLRHWKFLLIIILVNITLFMPLSFLPIEPLGIAINNIISYYFALFLTAIELIYYQKVIKK